MSSSVEKPILTWQMPSRSAILAARPPHALQSKAFWSGSDCFSSSEPRFSCRNPLSINFKIWDCNFFQNWKALHGCKVLHFLVHNYAQVGDYGVKLSREFQLLLGS